MPTEESIKVKNYLKKLKAGSRINTTLLAKQLDVPAHVVDTQLSDSFPNKFKRGKLWDPKTKRAFTYDGVKYEPKLFQYVGKNGITQNQRFWQNPPTHKNPGEWNVAATRVDPKSEFKTKDDALKFIEDKKIDYSGDRGKLR